MEVNTSFTYNESLAGLLNESFLGTDYVPYQRRFETYLIPVVFTLIFIFGMVGNGTLILIFLRQRSMRTIPNIYIFSLALGDILVLVSCVPFISVIYTFESWPWGEEICRISEATRDVSIGVSVFTLTTLSVERYCAIVHPMSRHMSTKPLAIITASSIWVVSFIFAIPAMLFTHFEKHYIPGKNGTIEYCIPFKNRYYGRLMVTMQFLIYYLIPIIVIGFFYSLMSRHLVLSTRSLPGEHGKGQSSQILARKKVAVTVLALVIAFIICFLPIRIHMLWFYYDDNYETNYTMFWHVSKMFGFCLQFLNSCVNPIALYFVSKAFRKYFNYYLACCPYNVVVEESFAYATNNSSISRRQHSDIVTSLRESQERSK